MRGKSRLHRKRMQRQALTSSRLSREDAEKYRQESAKRERELIQGSVGAISNCFSKYRADEVLFALNVSDLWLPNISSQAKHHLAFGIALSMQPDEFSRVELLDTYANFCEFTNRLHDLLPAISYLECFVPVADWGDVRCASNGKHPAIFYSSHFGRIPDRIEAYSMLRADQPLAMNDLAIAISLQNHMISKVSSEIVGSASGIEPGHIETPSESFWSACLEVLRSASNSAELKASTLSPSLILDQGKYKLPENWGTFSYSVAYGTTPPGLLARVNGELIPFSLRHTTSVVIDYWAERDDGPSSQDAASFSSRVRNFLAQRFDAQTVVHGPARLVSPTGDTSMRFDAIFKTTKKRYFLAMVAPAQLLKLSSSAQKIHQLWATSNDLVLLPEDRGQTMALGKSDGLPTNSSDAEIEILAVLTDVHSFPFVHDDLPKISARVLSFQDFVSVFDSLKEPNELDRFWAYFDRHFPIKRLMCGLAKPFASFRDSESFDGNGLGVATMMPRDHEEWRFRELKNFWQAG